MFRARHPLPVREIAFGLAAAVLITGAALAELLA